MCEVGSYRTVLWSYRMLAYTVALMTQNTLIGAKYNKIHEALMLQLYERYVQLLLIVL